MNQDKNETLSALLDGELQSADAQALFTGGAGEREQLRQTWARYHLTAQLLREPRQAMHLHGFAERVAAAVEQEPAILARPRHRGDTPASLPASGSHALPKIPPLPQRARFRRWAGLALAASVAALALVSLPRAVLIGGSPQPAATLASVPAHTAASTFAEKSVAAPLPNTALTPMEQAARLQVQMVAAQSGDADAQAEVLTSLNRLTPEARARLNAYLVDYSEQRAQMGSPGMMPYTQMVGFDADQ